VICTQTKESRTQSSPSPLSFSVIVGTIVFQFIP
jgi:hypothetical protein